MMKKITAVLPVPSIRESLPFWESLGFETTVSVPHGGVPGFVILQSGNLELMLQSHDSLGDDLPALADAARGGVSFLFVEVADIDAAEAALAAYELVSPKRKTFYGATEITWKEPGGHYVTCAEFE